MAKLTAAEIAEKHNRRTKGAIEDMRKGIENVTEAPTAKAAAKADKMLQNLMNKVKDGTWAARLKGVTLEDWKDKMINKGLNRVAGGLDGAMAKTEEFFSQLMPHVEKLQADVSKMPDLTLEDNINRATSWIRGMAKFKKK